MSEKVRIRFAEVPGGDLNRRGVPAPMPPPETGDWDQDLYDSQSMYEETMVKYQMAAADLAYWKVDLEMRIARIEYREMLKGRNVKAFTPMYDPA